MDNLFETRLNNILSGKGDWYNLAYSLYQSSDNTLSRFEENRNSNVIDRRQRTDYLEQMNVNRGEEVQLIMNLVQGQEEQAVQTTPSISTQVLQEIQNTVRKNEIREGMQNNIQRCARKTMKNS